MAEWAGGRTAVLLSSGLLVLLVGSQHCCCRCWSSGLAMGGLLMGLLVDSERSEEGRRQGRQWHNGAMEGPPFGADATVLLRGNWMATA